MTYDSFLRRLRAWLPWLILLAAFGLRMYRVDFPDITGDEAWSVTIAGRPLAQVVASDAETNPPLWHLTLWGMMHLAGRSTLVIRYAPVLFGMLALALIFDLGRSVGGRRLGLMALATGAISPFLVTYAQDARMYGPALLGAAGSMALFARLLAARPASGRRSRAEWVGYVLFSLVAVFSHYYAFAVLVAQGLFVLAGAAGRRRWAGLRPWLAAWGAMALVFLPWFAFHMTFLQVKTSSRFAELTPGVLEELFRRTLTAYAAGVTYAGSPSWLPWLVVGLAAAGAVALWRHPASRVPGLWLAVTVLVAPLFAWVVNPIMPFFWERYLLVGLPAFLVLAAAGIHGLARAWRPLALPAITLLLIVSGISLRHHYFDPIFIRGSYGRLMSDIVARSQPGDVILLNGPLQASLYDIYGPPDMPFAFIDRGQLLTDEATAPHLAALTAGYQRAWLVEMGNEAEYDPDQRAQAWLAEHGSRAYYESYTNGGLLYLFVLGDEAGPLTPIEANLADQIALTGFWLSATNLAPGETLRVTLAWRARAPIPRPYTVFNHLVAPDGLVAAQTDGEPVGGAHPTQNWQPGEIVRDNYAIVLPPDLAPGDYVVRVGMYRWPELTRLTVLAANRPVVDDGITLGTVTIR